LPLFLCLLCFDQRVLGSKSLPRSCPPVQWLRWELGGEEGRRMCMVLSAWCLGRTRVSPLAAAAVLLAAAVLSS
jgi:hypothetical protein